MSSIAMRRINPAYLILLPVTGLVAVLAARQPLGIQADPLRVIAVFLAAMLALALAARHPAAFLAPVMFLPRIKEYGVLDGMGPAANWTALQLACGLLGTGILMRWLWRAQSPGDPPQTPNPDGEAAYREDTQPRRTGREDHAAKAFLLFAAVVAVSYTYTVSPHYGGTKLLEFLGLGGGLFFAAPLLFADERDLRDLTLGTVLFGMVVAASSLSFSATGAMAMGANASHIGKGQAIGLATLLLLYAPVADRRLKALILLVCIPWLALGLVSAETRGPLFSLLLVLLLSLFVPALRSPLVSRKQMALAAVALAGAVMLLSAFWFYGAEAFKFRYKATELIALLQGSGEAQGTAVERLEFYRAAWRAWLQRPLFGWGVGGWSMVYWNQDFRQYPHNLFFEVLVEEGLMGIAALFLLLRSVFGPLCASVRKVSALFPALLPCLIYLLSIAMFSGDLDDDRFLWFWCGLTVVCCGLACRARSRGTQPQPEVEASAIPQPSPTLS